MIKPAIIWILTMNKEIDEPMHQKIQKMFIPVRDEVFPGKSLKKQVTLNDYMLRELGDYMLRELRRMKNVFATCYQVDRENFY